MGMIESEVAVSNTDFLGIMAKSMNLDTGDPYQLYSQTERSMMEE